MKFDTWLRTVCFKKPTKEAEDLARMAWNDAIKKAVEALHKGLKTEDGRILDDWVIEAVKEALK